VLVAGDLLQGANLLHVFCNTDRLAMTLIIETGTLLRLNIEHWHPYSEQ
jgi:hypothetical protein